MHLEEGGPDITACDCDRLKLHEAKAVSWQLHAPVTGPMGNAVQNIVNHHRTLPALFTGVMTHAHPHSNTRAAGSFTVS